MIPKETVSQILASLIAEPVDFVAGMKILSLQWRRFSLLLDALEVRGGGPVCPCAEFEHLVVMMTEM